MSSDVFNEDNDLDKLVDDFDDEFEEIDMSALHQNGVHIKGTTSWGTIITESEPDADNNKENTDNLSDSTELSTEVASVNKNAEIDEKKTDEIVTVDYATTTEIEEKIPSMFSRFSHVVWLVVRFILLLPYRIVKGTLRVSGVLINIFSFTLIISAIVGIFLYAKFAPMYEQICADAYDKLAHLSEGSFHMLGNTMVYDKDGKVIGEIDVGDYIYEDITNVSDYVQYGYIAVEDRRFREHLGVDLKSIIRAGWAVMTHNGEAVQGGSTITQQVIKNCVIQSQEKSYTRKFLEVILAPRVEQRFSKDKIMEFYVNTCYYGNRCYGIESASQYYFGKTNTKLTLAEAAMLCGVSNSPNNYNPIASKKLANMRKEKVLRGMLECEFITQDEYNKAIKEKVKLSIPDEKKSHENYMMSYALHCTTLELMKKDGFEFKYTFTNAEEEKQYNSRYSQEYSKQSATIRAGGFKIYTSFNRDLQAKLQSTIDKNLSSFKEKQRANKKYAMQGASVCIDNTNGMVVAMVGGRGTKDEFNRAFLSNRQPGSTIKPLLDYAPAINEGYINPSSIIDDKKLYNSKGEVYPKNSGNHYYGNVSIREGLARSLNTVAYQVYNRTGAEHSIEYLSKMCFSSLSYADNTASSLSIGGFTYGAKVVDMARGYSTLAMGGQYTTRTCLTKVIHEIDGEIYNYSELSKTQTQVYTTDTAFMMTDALQGGIEEEYGTAHSIKTDDMIVAGKTGTTSSNKDAWFCGYTKYYTTAVWVGYDNPREMEGMYGGTVPAKIFKDYMVKIKKNRTNADFEIPITLGLKQVEKGEYVGEVQTLEDYRAKLKEKLEKKNKNKNNKNTTKKKSKNKNKKQEDSEEVLEGEESIDLIRTYYLRKKGWEWFSIQNKEIYEKTQRDYVLETQIKLAKQAVNDFKSFFLFSAADCLELDERFQSCMDTILEVSDEYQQEKFKKQATNHYNKLSGEIRQQWEQEIQEYQEAEKERKKIEYATNIEQQQILADENLKNDRLRIAEWYVSQMATRLYYSNATKRLIKDAQEYIGRCSVYEEDYKNLMKRFDEYKKMCERLPLPPERPEVERDDEDTDPSEEEYTEPEYADEDY